MYKRGYYILFCTILFSFLYSVFFSFFLWAMRSGWMALDSMSLVIYVILERIIRACLLIEHLLLH